MDHGSVHAVPGSDLNRPAISATNHCLTAVRSVTTRAG